MKKMKFLSSLLLMLSLSSGAFAAGENVLTAYFSYGENASLPAGVDASASASIQMWDNKVTGNTGVVAHMINENVGGDLFSIQTVKKYPADYNETIDVGKDERNADARPALASHVENMDKYDTIFLGFPNWWSDMPMALYTFLDEYDLSGKTIIPFSTSGGSGLSNTVNSIKRAEPNANVLDGFTISGRRAVQAEREVLRELEKRGFGK